MREVDDRLDGVLRRQDARREHRLAHDAAGDRRRQRREARGVDLDATLGIADDLGERGEGLAAELLLVGAKQGGRPRERRADVVADRTIAGRAR